MAGLSLRRYDVQARLSVILGLLSLVALAGFAYVVMHRIDWSEYVIYYNKRRTIPLYLSGAVTLGLSIIGFGLGLNSVGQRRNELQKLSWLGFFISACVICLALALLFFFKARGEMVG